MAIRALVVRRPGEHDLVGRTIRALAAAGVSARDAGTDVAAAISAADSPVWLVHAGAWPAHPWPIESPPASASGRPLVAFGCSRGVRSNDPGVASSLYLEVEPARELARSLGEKSDFDEAAQACEQATAGASSDSRR